MVIPYSSSLKYGLVVGERVALSILAEAPVRAGRPSLERNFGWIWREPVFVRLDVRPATPLRVGSSELTGGTSADTADGRLSCGSNRLQCRRRSFFAGLAPRGRRRKSR